MSLFIWDIIHINQLIRYLLNMFFSYKIYKILDKLIKTNY